MSDHAAALKRAIDSSADIAHVPGDPLSKVMRARRGMIHKAMNQILDGAGNEKRGLLASEARAFDVAKLKIAEIDVRIGELEEAEASEARSAATRVETGESLMGPQNLGFTGGHWSVSGEARTYHQGAGSPSYFRDMSSAMRGDRDAIERLARNNAEVGSEQRALGNTNATGGAGGEFSPPAWVTAEWVRLARPGRVTADLFHHEMMPAGVSTINIPRVLSGTSVTAQTTQNTTVANVDMATAALSSGIVTIAGSQIISQQLLDQSSVPFDRIVLEDLTAEYARTLGTMVLTGTGTSGALRGYLAATSTNNITWTATTPTAAAFYTRLAQLQGQINATRYTAPDTLVMHPRRWAWFCSATDNSGRPFIVPSASGPMNTMAALSGTAGAAGHQGTVLGMDCYTDPNIPTNLGAGTNQDVVLMFPRNDIWLWESDLRAESFTAPYSTSISVVYRIFNYAAMIPDRYTASLGQLNGTGLVAPVYS